jgi:hypothetical protein
MGTAADFLLQNGHLSQFFISRERWEMNTCHGWARHSMAKSNGEACIVMHCVVRDSVINKEKTSPRAGDKRLE